jgi:uncharacterized membrane protein
MEQPMNSPIGYNPDDINDLIQSAEAERIEMVMNKAEALQFELGEFVYPVTIKGDMHYLVEAYLLSASRACFVYESRARQAMTAAYTKERKRNDSLRHALVVAGLLAGLGWIATAAAVIGGSI